MKRLTTIFVLSALLVGGFVYAQNEKNNGEAVIEDVESMSHDDMISTAKNLLGEMRTTEKETQKLLDALREEDDDILTLNCINKQLAAIKGFVKVSEQQNGRLAKQDTRESQENSFKLIALAAAKVQTLGEEAQNCVGEGQRFADSTIIERREDPDIANVEVIEEDDDSFDDAFAREREPELTPFQ